MQSFFETAYLTKYQQRIILNYYIGTSLKSQFKSECKERFYRLKTEVNFERSVADQRTRSYFARMW